MASNPLKFHPVAESEYLGILEWYQERSSTAASRFEIEFDRALQTVRDAPHRWPVYIGGCRRYILHQFPFLIVYAPLESHTVVLAIAHAHRCPGYWRDRI